MRKVGMVLCMAALGCCWLAMIGGVVGMLTGLIPDAPFHHPGLFAAECGAILQFPVIATARLFI